MLLRETFGGNNEFKQPVIYVAIAILVFTAITQVSVCFFLKFMFFHVFHVGSIFKLCHDAF